MKRCSALTAVLLLALSACSSMHWERIDRALLPSVLDYPNADSVVLLHHNHARFAPNPNTSEAMVDRKEHVRVLVTKASGIDRWSVIDLRLIESYMELVDFRARVVAPDGTEQSYGQDELEVIRQYLELYADDKRLRLTLPGVVPGAIVEWQSTIRCRDLQLFGASHHFEQAVPVLESSFEVRLPSDWGSVSDVDPATLVAEHSDDGNEQRLRWQATKLPARPSERFFGGTQVHSSVYVRLSHWTDDARAVTGAAGWADTSRYWAQRYRERKQPDEAIRAKVEELLAGISNTKQRIRRLYDWVRDEIEYVALEFGEGRWVPHHAAEVFAMGYGDCKDKAILLAAMLEAVDIDSQPVLVYAHEGLPPRASPVRAVHAFNHVILSVEGEQGRLFMDPTAAEIPLGFLPAMDQGANALVLSERGEDLLQLPKLGADDNRSELQAELKVAHDGTISGTFELRLSGTSAFSARAKLRRVAPGEPRQEAIRELMLVSARHVGKVEAEGLDDPDVPLTLRGELSMPHCCFLQDGLASGQGSSFRPIAAYDLLRDTQPVWPAAERHNHVVFGVPSMGRETLTLHLDSATWRPIEPRDTVIETNFARHRLVWSSDAQTLKLERTWYRDASSLEPNRYEDLLDYGARVRSAELRPILLVSEAPAGATAAPAEAPLAAPGLKAAEPVEHADQEHR